MTTGVIESLSRSEAMRPAGSEIGSGQIPEILPADSAFMGGVDSSSGIAMLQFLAKRFVLLPAWIHRSVIPISNVRPTTPNTI
jgi:hypothetical protein